MVQVDLSPPVCGYTRLRQPPRSIVTVLIETCRRVRIPIRNYLASVLPGLADPPVKPMCIRLANTVLTGGPGGYG